LTSENTHSYLYFLRVHMVLGCQATLSCVTVVRLGTVFRQLLFFYFAVHAVEKNLSQNSAIWFDCRTGSSQNIEILSGRRAS